MALRRMTLQDFVIVDLLEIDFASGFTALTGETGAGKSILVDAIQLVMGGRADAGFVRVGAKRADLVAEFDGIESARSWLEEGGFESHDGLLLRRTVDATGKSRGWINGVPATATQLRELGAKLVDIHGQHAWQSLMSPGAVRELLDAYSNAGSSGVAQAWNAWRSAVRALDSARKTQATVSDERARLQWQISELAGLAPKDGEWQELNAEHTRLGHTQALIEAAQMSVAVLDKEEGGIRKALSQARDALLNYEHLEPQFRSIATLLTDSLAQADEALHDLNAYLRCDVLDAERLQALDERVSLWISLARRFKRPPAELAPLLAGWRESLELLDAGSDFDLLESAERAEHLAYETAAKELSAQRAKAAPPLAAAVESLLQGLGMAGGCFSVRLTPSAQAGPHGLEDIEFLVASHPGQELRPIAKVASGGELSRIALAIAVTTSALGSASTLIFDEVDSGVGGAVAHTVGQLMQRLGTERQVLAVTHLAQVAAYADQHLVVSKERGKKASASSVTSVTDTGRSSEIARMLGGAQGSSVSLAHAEEMLELAKGVVIKRQI